MKAIGLFEAKTRLSEICDSVESSGEGVVVTRRGKPWVRIEPIRRERATTVQERREAWLSKESGRSAREPEFEPAARDKSAAPEAPLDRS